MTTLSCGPLWLIRSRASSVVLWGGRADQWFPALGCTVAAGGRLQQASPGCSFSVCWVLSSGLLHPPSPSYLSCVWSRSVCSLRQVQVNKCTERMWISHLHKSVDVGTLPLMDSFVLHCWMLFLCFCARGIISKLTEYEDNYIWQLMLVLCIIYPSDLDAVHVYLSGVFVHNEKFPIQNG